MAWLGLLATIAWNYRQYRAGRVTICGLTRRALPWPAAAAGLTGGFAYLLVHIFRGYPHPTKETP